MSEPPTEAAGAVVWREHGSRLQVLVIHRARYDDWSLPKGKLDPGEHEVSAAVREVHEETGVAVRLGPFLARHEYPLARSPGATKRVGYWCARPLDGTGDGMHGYEPNDEVDAVRWVPVDDAPDLLSYARDAAVLERFDTAVRARTHRSVPLVLLRHGAATPRKAWPGRERNRPLAIEGDEQARRLVPVLSAYGVRRVLSSDARRCSRTVRPYAEQAGVRVETGAGWSEEGASAAKVRTGVRGLLDDDTATVLCTHRPVLPWMLDALDVPAQRLEPAQLLVLHRWSGAVVGSELLRP